MYQSLAMQEGLFARAGVGPGDLAAFPAASAGLNCADDRLPYSTAELNAPEYSTDDFRMFSFKVARCSKRYVHDWRACPFAHPTENARRRDPRAAKYLPIPCPDYKRGICLRGDACSYSHGVYECWLHPAKYRTQLCKEGPACRRPVCFFAHSVLDIRQPTHLWAAGAQPSAAAAFAAAALVPEQTAAAALLSSTATIAVPRPASVASFSSPKAPHSRGASAASAEELSNNMQGAACAPPADDSPLRAAAAPEFGSSPPASAPATPHAAGLMTPADSGSLDSGGSLPSSPPGAADAPAPRMSNAFARKLGLAPARPSGGDAGRPPKPRAAPGGGTQSPGGGGQQGMDELLAALHGARAAHAAGFDGQQQPYLINPQTVAGLAGLGGYGCAPPCYAAPGPHDAMGLHPALLSIMAANMAGQIHPPAGMYGVPLQAGHCSHADAAAMASLLRSVQDWGLAPGAAGHGHSPLGGGGGQLQASWGGHHGAGHHNGAGTIPHRTSSDGLMGAAGLMPFYLPAELDSMLNSRGPSAGGC